MSPMPSVHGRAPCSTDYVEILDGTEVSLGKYILFLEETRPYFSFIEQSQSCVQRKY